MNQKSPENLADELGKQRPFSSLKQETYLNLLRTHEQLVTEFARFFKEHCVSDSQFNVLRILRGNKKPMQVYQIAEQMIFRQTDISRLIDRLHAAELVTRDRCGDDRRVVWVELTDKAKKLLRKMDCPLGQLHESQFANLSQRELVTLNNLLFRARSSEES